jgi:hypothetical protein
LANHALVIIWRLHVGAQHQGNEPAPDSSAARANGGEAVTKTDEGHQHSQHAWYSGQQDHV